MAAKQKKKVLIVDDEIAMEPVYNMLLGGEYSLIMRQSGNGAFGDIVGGLEFDAAIIDQTLGEGQIDGDKIAEKSKELYPDRPVIRISGYDDVDSMKGDYFLCKPFGADSLVSTVDKALAIADERR